MFVYPHQVEQVARPAETSSVGRHRGHQPRRHRRDDPLMEAVQLHQEDEIAAPSSASASSCVWNQGVAPLGTLLLLLLCRSAHREDKARMGLVSPIVVIGGGSLKKVSSLPSSPPPLLSKIFDFIESLIRLSSFCGNCARLFERPLGSLYSTQRCECHRILKSRGIDARRYAAHHEPYMLNRACGSWEHPKDEHESSGFRYENAGKTLLSVKVPCHFPETYEPRKTYQFFFFGFCFLFILCTSRFFFTIKRYFTHMHPVSFSQKLRCSNKVNQLFFILSFLLFFDISILQIKLIY